MPLSEAWRRLRLLFSRDRAAAELEEEMRLHLELRAHALQRDGSSANDAQYAARRQFGNATVLEEESRDAWGLGGIDELLQNIRYATRRLTKRPAFSLAIIGVLALGIGATTAMFSAVDAAMLRPLPFAKPEQLVVLHNMRLPFDARGQQPSNGPSPMLNITHAAAMPETFSGVAAYSSGGLNLSEADHPVRVKVGVVTKDFFATLGVRPVRGRTFSPEEGAVDGPHAVLLSEQLWRSHFGSGEVLDRSLLLNGKAYTVVGIMPRGFSFPDESDLWIPMSIPVTFATFEPFSGGMIETVIARLANGVSLPSADARLKTKWNQQIAASGVNEPGRRRPMVDRVQEELRTLGAVGSLQRQLVGDRRTALLVLLGATGLLLLIACANVTNLLLSQAAGRRREIAVREVLGATRGRVLRQLLTESVLLALAGAALGVALAPLALAIIGAMMPSALAGVAPATIDLRVLGFATLIGMVTGIGFGLWPALGTTRVAPGETIKSGSGHATARGGGRARRALVTAELALTLMLLVGAGLMLQSFARMMRTDRGMDSGHAATLEFTFPSSTHWRATRIATIDRILDQFATTDGISAVGVVNYLPLNGTGMRLRVDVDGAGPQDKNDESRYVAWLIASGGYFRALGIPLLEGRTFTRADDSLAPRVAVINRTMAKLFWPAASPLGHTFHMPGDSGPVTVIGIASDVRDYGLDQEPFPQMYLPVDFSPPSALALVARGTLPPGAMLARLTAAVRTVDPTQAVFHVRMMDDVVGSSVAPQRTNTLLIAAFAALALILAVIGVYAVVAYGVAQRSREFGIRAALGATGRDLVALVSREMVWVVGLGCTLGLAGAWTLAKVLTTLLYGIDVHDTMTFVAVPVVLALAAAVATVIPARRALRVNPSEVIRAE